VLVSRVVTVSLHAAYKFQHSKNDIIIISNSITIFHKCLKSINLLQCTSQDQCELRLVRYAGNITDRCQRFL